MILDAIIGGAMSLVTAVLGLFPAYDFDHNGLAANVFHTVGGVAAFGNSYFPLTTIGFCMGLIVTTHLFVWAVKLILTAYDMIPFKAS